MIILFIIISILILIEFSLYKYVKFKKKLFPWLLFDSDTYPKFQKELINKFFKLSFDKHLGWNRTSNTKNLNGINNKLIDDFIQANPTYTYHTAYRKIHTRVRNNPFNFHKPITDVAIEKIVQKISILLYQSICASDVEKILTCMCLPTSCKHHGI